MDHDGQVGEVIAFAPRPKPAPVLHRLEIRLGEGRNAEWDLFDRDGNVIATLKSSFASDDFLDLLRRAWPEWAAVSDIAS